MPVNKDRIVKLFKELVQIDSISLEERLMVDRLTQELKDLGADVVEDETGKKIGGNAGNIIADFRGNKDVPSLVLSAHMDRVQPGKGIKPVIKGDYITSSGDTVLGGDDLVGVCAILETLRVLKEDNVSTGPLKIIFTVAEELGLQGGKYLHSSHLAEADFGVVLDADGDIGTIINRAPSQIKFNAIIKGRSAHAGMNPERGINAIKIASQAISSMRLGRINKYTTANIGVIKGGIATNVVPDMVVLEGEARSHHEMELNKQVEHMKGVIEKAVERYSGSAEFKLKKLYSSFSLEENKQPVKYVKEIGEKLGYNVNCIASGGGSDANIFNEKGLPTVNLGIGMENVHTREERVKIKSLVDITEYVTNLVTSARHLKNL
ncbi:M20/M25/M40 family metallo-hydrolase [Halothermothrix orenii]|uniref:Peptidase T-like protein n=1 Tax=Halothermothrix orenii (strain H 168 / OCM 544 / DSM 9562) TaxID=373903 RepID=B8CVW9_HALOH|nr:M20/M25/M40 family metallo-hydrolase [Halothermothrix orenii]ACL69438.1 peptidase T-like protein [Halothermothrix orenii H 168]